MPQTKRGIFHNLRESKYTVSNGEIVFFFSSDYYLKKFMEGYKNNRKQFLPDNFKVENLDKPNISLVADIYFYLCTEKRGFYVWFKNYEIDVFDLYNLALDKLIDENILEWEEIVRPRLKERISNMGR